MCLVQKLDDEDALMQELRDRLGPYASQSALLYHLRAARGKLNWAGIHLGGQSSMSKLSQCLQMSCSEHLFPSCASRPGITKRLLAKALYTQV